MLTMLNECGDTTLSWTEDQDEEMEKIIRKKMEEGVTFFIVEPRGRKPAPAKRGAKLEDAAQARKGRALIIPDEDFSAFVQQGRGQLSGTPAEPIKGERISRDAKEVAKSQSVAVKQRRGG
jgi:hypothetical protein